MVMRASPRLGRRRVSFGEDIVSLVNDAPGDALSKAESWERVPLGEIATVLNGYPWKSEYFGNTEGVPLIRIRDMSTGVTETRYNGPIIDGFWVEPGDLLVGMDGDFHLRRWHADRGLLNQRVCKLETSPDYSSRFLEYILPPYLQLINDNTSSVTVKHLSSRTLVEVPLPLPPIAEQCRIVAKLDALTARLARARAELDRVLTLVGNNTQRVLAECFNEKTSNQAELGSILRGIEAGKNMRCEERPPREGERGVVKVSAVTWGRFDPGQSKTLPSDYNPPAKVQIHAGDLLISRANTLELVGAVVLVDVEPRELFLSDKILRLVLDEDAKKWVLWFLRSAFGRKQIEELATGNQLSMRNIGQNSLRSIRLPFPDAETRLRLTKEIEVAFARAARLEAEAAHARALLDRLESAILAKAFRGELVSQDPNDEPASVLLGRIRAQRTAIPAAKGNRRGAKRAALEAAID